MDLPQCLIVVRETIVEISRKNSPTGERYQVKRYPKSNKPRVIKIGQELTEQISDRIANLGMGPEDLLVHRPGPASTHLTQHLLNQVLATRHQGRRPSGRGADA